MLMNLTYRRILITQMICKMIQTWWIQIKNWIVYKKRILDKKREVKKYIL